MDSSASHQVANDLNTLPNHASYDGTVKLVISDGSFLKITHIGSLIIHTQTTTPILRGVLCVPTMFRNIIFISRLCYDNYIQIQFFQCAFPIKDPN